MNIDIDIKFERLHEKPKRVEFKLNKNHRMEIFYSGENKTCGVIRTYDEAGFPHDCWFHSALTFDEDE